MIKLVSIVFHHPMRSGPLRDGFVDVLRLEPAHRLAGWRLQIKGPDVALISPPGWEDGRPAHTRDPRGPRMVYVVPRMSCTMTFSSDDDAIDFAKIQQFTSEPFGRPAQTVEPASQADPAPTE